MYECMFSVHLQPLPDIVLGLANKMSIFVVEKSVATLLAVKRDNGPPVPDVFDYISFSKTCPQLTSLRPRYYLVCS